MQVSKTKFVISQKEGNKHLNLLSFIPILDMYSVLREKN